MRGLHPQRRAAAAVNRVTMSHKVVAIKRELRRIASREKAEASRWFFKTGPGEYGDGDRFIGVGVPDLRRMAKRCDDLTLDETAELLASPIHEERLLALLVMVRLYDRSNQPARRKIYMLYLSNTRYINNWDLVDLSAHHIVGSYLENRSRRPLYRLAKSKSLWERRISVLATFHFIRNHDFEDALNIAERLLTDEHDLIHKAVGWMLREIGKRRPAVEERFLKDHYTAMPRTMLRYAIEKFPERKRQRYLKGKA